MKKKLFYGLAVVSLFTLNSCGEDREDNTEQQKTLSQKIIGTWTISQKETNGVVIPKPQMCQNHGNFIFKEEKKLFENYNSTVNNNCVTDTDLYNYSIDENSKKISATNGYGDNMTYTISTINDNTLTLIYKEGSETIKYSFTR